MKIIKHKYIVCVLCLICILGVSIFLIHSNQIKNEKINNITNNRNELISQDISYIIYINKELNDKHKYNGIDNKITLQTQNIQSDTDNQHIYNILYQKLENIINEVKTKHPNDLIENNTLKSLQIHYQLHKRIIHLNKEIKKLTN